MQNFRRLIICILIFCFFSYSFSQESDRGLLTINRIFNSYEFYPDFYGPVKWLEDGSGFTTVEYSSAVPGGQDLCEI